MISKAGLARIELAARNAEKGNSQVVSISTDDAFSVVRTVEQLRDIQTRHEELKGALALVGEALRDELR